MKKILLPVLAAATVLSFSGCQKTGTVSGQVVDPFTGKAVEMPTVWIDSSVFGTQKDSYDKTGLSEGKFSFKNVPAGTYLIKARRNKYIMGQQTFTTTEKNPNATVTLYEYGDTVTPGMYLPDASGAKKITNEWAIFGTTCKESVAGLRKSFEQDLKASAPGQKKSTSKKDVKVNKLPAAKVVGSAFEILYCNPGSVTVAVEAASYPAVSAKVASHADCSGFEQDETGIFPDLSKKTSLEIAYKAEGLYEIKGTLPKGRQLVVFSKEGKTLQTYYLEVK